MRSTHAHLAELETEVVIIMSHLENGHKLATSHHIVSRCYCKTFPLTEVRKIAFVPKDA
jgi:hypothetical protein